MPLSHFIRFRQLLASKKVKETIINIEKGEDDARRFKKRIKKERDRNNRKRRRKNNLHPESFPAIAGETSTESPGKKTHTPQNPLQKT